MAKAPENYYYVTGAAVLLVGIGAFMGGVSYQKGQSGAAPTVAESASVPSQSQQRQGQGMPGSGFAGGRTGRGGFAGGTVTAVGSGTFTLETIQGTAQTVDVTDSTSVEKTVSGSVSDIATGDSVTVTGSAGSDGNVQATGVTIRPSNAAGGAPGSL